MKVAEGLNLKLVLTLLVSYLILSPVRINAQLERVIVETYYISDKNDSTDTEGGKLPEGSVTYRVYADLAKGSKLLAVYGNSVHPIIFSSTQPFFNNIDGQTYARDIKKTKYNQNTVALDTYLTLGQTATILSGKTNFGVPKHLDRDGSFIGGINNDGGSSAIAGGLLVNNNPKAGKPLTVADGMDTMMVLPTKWEPGFGIKNFISGIDSTIFGSVVPRSKFSSRTMFLRNSGTRGVNADSNQVLIAQLTTKGELSFKINLEVEQNLNGETTIIKYVGSDSVLQAGEKTSRYMNYPFPAPNCGCKDPAYIEYNTNFECADNASFCKTKIVLGCTDQMACNFDPKATYSLPSLCCYIGSCNGRDISVVCPKIKGSSFSVVLSPNPVEDQLTLNVNGGAPTTIDITILNYAGTVVYAENFIGTERLLNHVIDFNNQPSGIYFLKVTYNGEVTRNLFVKQ